MLFGVVAAAACLVRPQWLLVMATLAAVPWIVPRWREWRRAALMGATTFVLVLAPWHARNALLERATGEPSLLASTLYHGSFEDLRYRGLEESYAIPYRYDPEAAIHGRDPGAALSRIAELFRERPAGMTRWFLVGKPRMFLSWGLGRGRGDIFTYPVSESPFISSPLFATLREGMRLLHLPIVVAALLAMAWVAVARRATGTPVGGFWAMCATALAVLLLAHMVGAPFPRYAIPFLPLLYLLATLGANALSNVLHGVGPAQLTRRVRI